ncbi:phage tail tape measure protein [Sphingomonas carotinifaciens]|uniref:phage tail tape measure protein n=1 Tax=Sphingomonas carotinifaciens TaxID=1166323 RepID=UPI0039A0B5A7
MQALLASLVFSMSVKDQSFRAAMATNRQEVRRTRQDFDQQGAGMVAAMQNAARRVDEAAIRMVDRLKQLGDEVQRAGLVLTVGLSAPLGLLAKASKDTASDFQAAMNNVHSAMVNASPDEMNRLREAALSLGPAYGKSAIEAASAIEALAKNGMDAAAILSGGLEGALKLGVLGQTELGSAADATTDILQQFHLSTSQLPDIVDKVSGALDASKLSFNGYKDAIGMVGGIAGGLGYQFEDMNTALAAVIPLMTGGSDAGTSFKTFLLSLKPQSKEAARVMKDLGLSFFDASGNAKSLSEASDLLHRALDPLTQETRQDALTQMFGQDGMRVALALMQAGADGIAKVQAQIDEASADRKIAILMDGEAAATQRLASAWEKLKIAIGEAGIIQAFTLIKDAAASMLSVIGSGPPWFYKLAVGVGALAASIGPLTLVAVGLAKVALPLLALRLGPVALGMAAIINPAGVLISLLGRLALQAGAATVVGRLGTALLGVAGPIGLLITAMAILLPLLFKKAEASNVAREAVDAARQAEDRAKNTALELAAATDKTREAVLAKAKADRIAAVDAMRKAQADMAAARATYVRAKADAEQASQVGSGVGDGEGGFGVAQTAATRRAQLAVADFQARIDALTSQQQALVTLNNSIAQAEKPTAAKISMSFDDPEKERKKKGRDAARDEANYLDELGRSRVELLRAQADLTESARARYTAEIASLDEDQASYARQLEVDKGLTDAKRATLLAAREQTIEIQRQVAAQTLERALQQESYDLAKAVNDQQQDALRAQLDAVDNLSARRDIELRLLDLQRQQEEADLDLVLATKATASAEWDNARKRKEGLDAIFAARRDQVMRGTEGPAANYMRVLNRSTSAIGEDVERGGVEALQDLNTGLTDAIMGTAKLSDAFANMGKRIVGTLLDIAIQQALIKPLANSLFGGSSGGGGLFGSLGSIFSSFGGGRASGGPVSGSEWYLVGEQGPELFAPGVSGTIVPNGGLGAGGRRGDTYVDLRNSFVDKDLWAKVDSMASYRAKEAYTASAQHTEAALAGVARQRL